MPYRKFSADRIFDGKEMVISKRVLITDESGKIVDLVDSADAGEGVEVHSGILMPGFVNCHCHLELSHMRGRVGPGLGMVDFLLSVMHSRSADADEIQTAAADAATAMEISGIVAVGDICNTAHTVRVKAHSSIHFHNFIEALGFAPDGAEASFERAESVLQDFAGDGTIVPHAPYSVSRELFRRIDSYQPGSLQTIHNQESHGEVEFMETGGGDFLRLYSSLDMDVSHFRGTGVRGIASWLSRISAGRRLILVHNTVTSTEDVNWVKFNNTILPDLYWCVCPQANIYINDMLPDLPMLVRSGCRIVIGTDSLASNENLDMVRELSSLQIQFPLLPLVALLHWSTFNGAKALGLDHQFGSFENGKLPGIVILDGMAGDSLASARSRRLL